MLFVFFFFLTREGGNFKAATKQENKAAQSVCQGGQPWKSQHGTLLRIRKLFLQAGGCISCSKSPCHLTQDLGYIPKGLLRSLVSSSSSWHSQQQRAAGCSTVQQGAAGDGSPTRTSEALGSYRRPWRAKLSSFSPERWVLRGEGEWTRTSSSSHCSKSTGQIRDTDRAGRPAALGACTSSSFFVVSIGGQAGQSHFFLRVLQVICKRQREVKGELNGKPFITQNAT